MIEKKRVLITGHLGFIGSIVAKNLRAAGYDVWGIDRREDGNDQSLVANLLDFQQTSEIISKVPSVHVLIHMAALAHEEKPSPNYSIFDFNVSITKNIIDSIGEKIPHMIFMSSVAVYGEDDRPLPVSVDVTPRPSNEYGRSKLVCENLVLNSKLTKYDILRMAPVFDDKHLRDVSKRVYFPGLRGIKIRMLPPPYYSLCHVNRIGGIIKECILRSGSGGRILHIVDPYPYSQNELIKWFKGITIPFPVIFARPLYLLGRMIPGAKGYAIRCLFSKLFLSNVYDV